MNANQEVRILAEQLYFNTKIRKNGSEIEHYVSPRTLADLHGKLGMALRRAMSESAPQLRVIARDEKSNEQQMAAETLKQDLQLLALNTKEQVACFLRHVFSYDDVKVGKGYVAVFAGSSETLRVIGSQQHPEWRTR